MAYFLVFQNKTYEEESVGGYLWAPQSTKSGREMFHWSNMKKIQPGDYIFSVVNKHIVSINRAEENYKEASRPVLLDKEEQWEKEGWSVKVQYQELENPMQLSTHMDQLLPLCQEKYAPFTKTGKGRQGYLFEITNPMGEYLKDTIEEQDTRNEFTTESTEDALKMDEEIEMDKETQIDDITQTLENQTEEEIKPSLLSRLADTLFGKGR